MVSSEWRSVWFIIVAMHLTVVLPAEVFCGIFTCQAEFDSTSIKYRKISQKQPHCFFCVSELAKKLSIWQAMLNMFPRG